MNAAFTGMGLWTPQGPPQWHPAPPAVKNLCQSGVDLCKSEGVNPVRLAIHFALRSQDISTHLFSTTRLSELRANLDSLVRPLTTKEIRVTQHVLNLIHNARSTKVHHWEDLEMKQHHEKLHKFRRDHPHLAKL